MELRDPYNLNRLYLSNRLPASILIPRILFNHLPSCNHTRFPHAKLALKFTVLRSNVSPCRYASGQNHLTDFIGMEPSKKRKRRTSFTPQALELLNAHFERNTHPSGWCLHSKQSSKMYPIIYD